MKLQELYEVLISDAKIAFTTKQGERKVISIPVDLSFSEMCELFADYLDWDVNSVSLGGIGDYIHIEIVEPENE